MLVNNRIGVMQGRLSPIAKDKIQVFPWKHWKEEFKKANELGIHKIEWVITSENIWKNPIFNNPSEIEKLCKKYNIYIPSVTCDFMMEEPIFKTSKKTKEDTILNFQSLIITCGKLNIRKIMVPLVDNSSLCNQEQENYVIETFDTSFVDLLYDYNIRLCIESDYPPIKLKKFLYNLHKPSNIHKNVFAINYDIGNSASLGYDFKEELLAYGRYIANVHVKDRVLHGNTVPLGMGNAKISEVIYALELFGYKGNYILQTARDREGKHEEVISKYSKMIDVTLKHWGDLWED